MTHDPWEQAKRAHLKQEKGEELSAEERASLAAFREHPAGAQYARRSRELAECLDGVTRDPPSLAELIDRFEGRRRREAEEFLSPKRLVSFFAAVLLITLLGVCFVLFVPHPRHGFSERLLGVGVLVVWMTVFGGAMCWTAARTRRPKPRGTLLGEERAAGAWWSSPLGWLLQVLLGFLALAAVLVSSARSGPLQPDGVVLWSPAVGNIAVVLALFFLVTLLYRWGKKSERGRDEELWRALEGDRREPNCTSGRQENQ
ncbi:MAG: hypothetical protein D6731_04380 [Planctomycetota bacterium]|nr:MAG: hypothetical protein D6731_04380 [Planctomycetota bacterium]